MGDKLKEVTMEMGVLACDSHPSIGKAEFSVLCMKFGNNKSVCETINYLDKKVSKVIDFDQQMSDILETKSIFTELILHFQSDSQLIRGKELDLLEKHILLLIEAEKERVKAIREARTEHWVEKP